MELDGVREGSGAFNGRCGRCGLLGALRTLFGEEAGAQGEAEIQDLLGACREDRQVDPGTEAGRSGERGQRDLVVVVDDAVVVLLQLLQLGRLLAEIHCARCCG